MRIELRLRILHVFMFLAGCALIVMAALFFQSPSSHPSPVFAYAVYFCVVFNLVISLALLKFAVARYYRALAVAGADASILARKLLASHMLVFVLAESTILYGFVLHVLGGRAVQTVPPYLAGLLLFVLATPRRMSA